MGLSLMAVPDHRPMHLKNAPRDAYRAFVEREREAIMGTLAESARMNAELRALAQREIRRLRLEDFREGEDVVKSIAALAKTVDTLRTSDAGLAALEADARWRSDLPLPEVEGAQADPDFMDLRSVN